MSAKLKSWWNEFWLVLPIEPVKPMKVDVRKGTIKITCKDKTIYSYSIEGREFFGQITDVKTIFSEIMAVFSKHGFYKYREDYAMMNKDLIATIELIDIQSNVIEVKHFWNEK